ncbi:hypothetical protein [Glaciimonas sp. PCH181]|uniref:hypothetical protein n=1 Tax=Glaciimonas sp. PCH181 TaxID=2133943 RepID=UPI00191BE60A|nr:hypothetical protein [Glaciimonas sp. PCH181]
MPLTCPHCHSERIHLHNYAKKTCGAIGAVAGATAGAVGIVSGAEIGAFTGLMAGPAGAAIGGIAGAIIGGLFGGATGCAAGVQLGEIIDAHILNNYHCLACQYTFSTHPVAAHDKEGNGDDYPRDRPSDFYQDGHNHASDLQDDVAPSAFSYP